MADPRTTRRWPYRAASPVRAKRVVKAKDDAPRGVRRRADDAPPSLHITPKQARLALAAAMLLGVLSVAWWAYHSSYLTVGEPQVVGTSQIPPQQVREAAGIDGASVFGLDLEAARQRVAALPKVRSATIEKHGWSGVVISVQERTTWGAWQINGVNVPIDVDGYVLDGAPPAEGLPVIQEIDPHRAINAGDRIDPGAVTLADRLMHESDTAFGRRVLALIYREDAGLTAILSGADVDGKAIWVTFGDDRDYDYKIAALYVLMEQAKDKDLALNAVDLRFGDRLSFN